MCRCPKLLRIDPSMVNLPVSIPRNILVATLEAGTSTLADPIRRKYAYFTAARRASKQRIRLSGHFWCQKPMARWHHGQPHRRNQPPRAAGRSLSTQNFRRRAGSVPRDPLRTRFGAPPTRRWSRFLCYLVRLVAHAPGGLRSAERTRRDDSKRPTWHRFGARRYRPFASTGPARPRAEVGRRVSRRVRK